MRRNKPFIPCVLLFAAALLAPPLIWTGVPFHGKYDPNKTDTIAAATADCYRRRNWIETEYTVHRGNRLGTTNLLIGDPTSRGPLLTETIASWPQRVNRQLQDGSTSDGIVIHEVGWPLRFLTYRRDTILGDGDQTWTIHGAFLLHQGSTSNACLPYRIIGWNAAALAALVLFGGYGTSRLLTALVHARRAKSGRCTTCGYLIDPTIPHAPSAAR